MASAYEVLFVLVSAISAFSCGTILLTGLLFPQLRQRYFMHIILMIALSDFFTSLAGSWGFPGQESNLCAAQGFMISVRSFVLMWPVCMMHSCLRCIDVFSSSFARTGAGLL
jgi:predicted neutral ceramidase superfamily lipid hydrolase